MSVRRTLSRFFPQLHHDIPDRPSQRTRQSRTTAPSEQRNRSLSRPPPVGLRAQGYGGRRFWRSRREPTTTPKSARGQSRDMGPSDTAISTPGLNEAKEGVQTNVEIRMEDSASHSARPPRRRRRNKEVANPPLVAATQHSRANFGRAGSHHSLHRKESQNLRPSTPTKHPTLTSTILHKDSATSGSQTDAQPPLRSNPPHRRHKHKHKHKHRSTHPHLSLPPPPPSSSQLKPLSLPTLPAPPVPDAKPKKTVRWRSKLDSIKTVSHVSYPTTSARTDGSSEVGSYNSNKRDINSQDEGSDWEDDEVEPQIPPSIRLNTPRPFKSRPGISAPGGLNPPRPQREKWWKRWQGKDGGRPRRQVQFGRWQWRRMKWGRGCFGFMD